MDLTPFRHFMKERLSRREAMEEAAGISEISVATLYRYKSNPSAMPLGVLSKMSEHFGMPLAGGVAWSKMDVLPAENRRLRLEESISASSGARFIVVAPYTVNDELPAITRLLLQADYGTKFSQLERPVLELRAKRAKLYSDERYDSWEIWNGLGYADFFFGRGRFGAIPEELRKAQIDIFRQTSASSKRHRAFYVNPDLPTFGCYSDPGVALVRVDDIHLEFQAPELVASFEETFNDLLKRCRTQTRDEFAEFLHHPLPE